MLSLEFEISAATHRVRQAQAAGDVSEMDAAIAAAARAVAASADKAEDSTRRKLRTLNAALRELHRHIAQDEKLRAKSLLKKAQGVRAAALRIWDLMRLLTLMEQKKTLGWTDAEMRLMCVQNLRREQTHTDAAGAAVGDVSLASYVAVHARINKAVAQGGGFSHGRCCH